MARNVLWLCLNQGSHHRANIFHINAYTHTRNTTQLHCLLRFALFIYLFFRQHSLLLGTRNLLLFVYVHMIQKERENEKSREKKGRSEKSLDILRFFCCLSTNMWITKAYRASRVNVNSIGFCSHVLSWYSLDGFCSSSLVRSFSFSLSLPVYHTNEFMYMLYGVLPEQMLSI